MPSSANADPDQRAVGWIRFSQVVLTILLFAQTSTLAYRLVKLWPSGAKDAPAVSEANQLYLVMIAGALGATLHAIYSFCDYVGNDRFKPSWIVWYVCRAPVGAAIATVFYLVLRGGLIGFGEGQELNLYGIAGMSALAGMFSRQAVTKLNELATTFFTKLTPQRDALQNPRPTLDSIRPTSVAAGTKGAKITLLGTGFTPGMMAVVNRLLCETRVVSTSEAEFVLNDNLSDTVGTLKVGVRNPDPSPGESETQDLAITNQAS